MATFAPPPPGGGLFSGNSGGVWPSTVQFRWNRQLVNDLVITFPDRAFEAGIIAGAEAGAASIRSQYKGWGTGKLAADVATPKFLKVGGGSWAGLIGSGLPYAWMEDQGLKAPIRRKDGGLLPIMAPARMGMVTGGDTGLGATRRGQYQGRSAIAFVREVAKHPAKHYLAAAEATYLLVFDDTLLLLFPK